MNEWPSGLLNKCNDQKINQIALSTSNIIIKNALGTKEFKEIKAASFNMSFIDGVTNFSIYYSTIDLKQYIIFINDIIKGRTSEPELNSSEILSLLESPEKIITQNSPRNSARKRAQQSASLSGIQFANPKRTLFSNDPSLETIKEKNKEIMNSIILKRLLM